MKISDSKTILKALGFDESQQTDVCCYTLLALANITPSSEWSSATNEWMRSRDIMDFILQNYNKKYADGSREYIRKDALHKFRMSGVIEDNNVCTNSPNYSYRLTSEAHYVIRAYNTEFWDMAATEFANLRLQIRNRYAFKRMLQKIPVVINGIDYKLSPGAHNLLQKQILEKLLPLHIPNARCLYCGDTAVRNFYKETAELMRLNIDFDIHSKLPDVILYRADMNRLYIIEAVASTGPISEDRLIELDRILSKVECSIVFITAFDKLETFRAFSKEIAMCSAIWIAEIPEQIYHQGLVV